MNYIVLRKKGTRRYYHLHCSTRYSNEAVLWTTLWYVKYERGGIMDYIVAREIGMRRYYGLPCSTWNRNEAVLSTTL